MVPHHDDPSEPPATGQPKAIDFDLAIFLRLPKPVVFAAWGCFIVMVTWLVIGKGMADWVVACLILTAGLLMQIQMRIVWWISLTLVVIGLLYFLGLAIDRLRGPANSFELSVVLLSVLLTAIIAGLLLLPGSKAFYRNEPKGD